MYSPVNSPVKQNWRVPPPTSVNVNQLKSAVAPSTMVTSAPETAGRWIAGCARVLGQKELMRMVFGLSFDHFRNGGAAPRPFLTRVEVEQLGGIGVDLDLSPPAAGRSVPRDEA